MRGGRRPGGCCRRRPELRPRRRSPKDGAAPPVSHRGWRPPTDPAPPQEANVRSGESWPGWRETARQPVLGEDVGGVFCVSYIRLFFFFLINTSGHVSQLSALRGAPEKRAELGTASGPRGGVCCPARPPAEAVGARRCAAPLHAPAAPAPPAGSAASSARGCAGIWDAFTVQVTFLDCV